MNAMPLGEAETSRKFCSRGLIRTLAGLKSCREDVGGKSVALGKGCRVGLQAKNVQQVRPPGTGRTVPIEFWDGRRKGLMAVMILCRKPWAARWQRTRRPRSQKHTHSTIDDSNTNIPPLMTQTQWHPKTHSNRIVIRTSGSNTWTYPVTFQIEPIGHCLSCGLLHHRKNWPGNHLHGCMDRRSSGTSSRSAARGIPPKILAGLQSNKWQSQSQSVQRTPRKPLGLTRADIVRVDVKRDALSNVCIRCASDMRLFGSSVGGKAYRYQHAISKRT